MMSLRHTILLLVILPGLSCQQKIPDADFDIRAVSKEAIELQLTEVEINDKLEPHLLKPSTLPYQLGPGDILEIEIAEMPGTLKRTFVMPDGMIYYDLAEGIHAKGLTAPELAKQLTEKLKRDYTDPWVNVSLVEVLSNRYWILGRVHKPGLYPLRQPTTLLDAVAQSGGLFSSAFSGTTEELADLSNSIIMRDGVALPVDFERLIRAGDTSQNIYLEHNDYIYLPSSTSASVLMLGAVLAPAAIGYKDNLTLIDCIAQCKGPARNAYLKEVVIVRGSLKDASAAVVNLYDILTGKESNVLLKSGDIVWVPKKPLGLLESTIRIAFQAAARTVASNEGSNFAGGERRQLSIPLGIPDQ